MSVAFGQRTLRVRQRKRLTTTTVTGSWNASTAKRRRWNVAARRKSSMKWSF